MIRLARCVPPVGILLAALVSALVLPVGPTQAQKRSVAAGEGGERLTLKFDWHKDRDEYNQFQALRTGAQPVDKSAEPILDHGAQWYAYRLTDIQYQYQAGKPVLRPMHDLVRDGMEQIIDPRDPRRQPNPNQLVFADEFGRRFTACLHEVVKNTKVIARLNAAILLARLAATGQEEAGDVLAEVIEDPKENDGVKLYALKGLGDLFSLTHGDNPVPFKKEREAAWAQALTNYLTRKVALRPGAPREEVAAIPYVRVQAVKALGQTRFPAVTQVANKKTTIQRPTAWVLLRVVRKDGLTPPPNLKEQVAAVVALSQLQSKLCDDYQADYVAYHIGQFLVEFASLYENRAQLEEQSKRKEPWKVYAAQLVLALDNLVADLDSPPRNGHTPYVAGLTAQAKEAVLNPILSGAGQGPQANNLIAFLQNNPPRSTSVFKHLPEAVIKEGEKAAE